MRPSIELVAGRAVLVMIAIAAAPRSVRAQLPVTRADAERLALAQGSRVALARADTAAARAALITARALPNPSLSAQRTGAPPQRHLIFDVPFDAPWVRGPRVGAARAQHRAAQLRFISERAAALLDVDTTYTRALGAQAHFRLSRQTARDAESLRAMTASRRNAGDASDLDVDLATVTSGQQANVAASDSLTFMSTLLTLQTLMGIPADGTAIVLVDSLRLEPNQTGDILRAADSLNALGLAAALSSVPTSPAAPPPAMPTTTPSGATPITAAPNMPTPGAVQTAPATPSVVAAEANLRAAELAVTRERRSVLNITSLQLGMEWHEPTTDPVSDEKLWVFGVTVPLPIFNQNQGAIAAAYAARDRARAELAAARLNARQLLVAGLKELASLRARVARDQELVIRAERVASKSLTAYREGASALPAVLAARRSAREMLGQYIDDLTALIALEAELRVLTQTVPRQ